MLAFAWDAHAFTATDVMAATGLMRSTTIAAIDELLEMGLLRELPNARVTGEYSKGRPARRFELRADAAAVVGMDVGRAHLTTVVADLRGEQLARVVVELSPAQDTSQGRRSAVLHAMESALLAAGRCEENVVAVCLGVPAPVDVHGESPTHQEGFWQRMNPDLRSLIADRVPLVRVENDASLAAVAEGSVGVARGLRDFVVVLAGDRLGAGVVIDGHLLRGRHGGVGELRALDHVRGVDSADGIGLRLAEWAREELEAGVVPPEIVEQVSRGALTGRAVLRLAGSGDVWAQRLVRRAGALVARMVSIFDSIYDPEVVVIAGAVADDLDEVLDSARTHLAESLETPPQLVGSRLGADAVATGAVAAAREVAQRGILHLEEWELERLLDGEAVGSPSS